MSDFHSAKQIAITSVVTSLGSNVQQFVARAKIVCDRLSFKPSHHLFSSPEPKAHR